METGRRKHLEQRVENTYRPPMGLSLQVSGMLIESNSDFSRLNKLYAIYCKTKNLLTFSVNVPCIQSNRIIWKTIIFQINKINTKECSIHKDCESCMDSLNSSCGWDYAQNRFINIYLDF